MVTVNKDDAEPTVPSVKVEVINPKFCGRHHDLINCYEIFVSQMIGFSRDNSFYQYVLDTRLLLTR